MGAEGPPERISQTLPAKLSKEAPERPTTIPGFVQNCPPPRVKEAGHPTAKAEAVSPPATEKAKGKLLAPKTATGPIGINIRRISGRGGVRSGSAASTRKSCQLPSRATWANIRSCAQVRARSPVKRA